MRFGRALDPRISSCPTDVTPFRISTYNRTKRSRPKTTSETWRKMTWLSSSITAGIVVLFNTMANGERKPRNIVPALAKQKAMYACYLLCKFTSIVACLHTWGPRIPCIPRNQVAMKNVARLRSLFKSVEPFHELRTHHKTLRSLTHTQTIDI